MKKITLIILTLLTIGVTQAQSRKVKGNGKVVTKERSVGSFDGVSVSGSFDVEIIKGKEGDMTIRGDENLMEYLITEVEGGDLRIKWKKGYNISTNNSFKITLQSDSKLSSARLSGSGEIVSKESFTSSNFDVAISGSGDIELIVNAKDVKAAISGSGDIQLKGASDYFESAVSGSGDIEALGLSSKKASIKVSGSGDTSITVQDEIYARVSGSGDIEYGGNPEIENIKVSGSGDVTKR